MYKRNMENPTTEPQEEAQEKLPSLASFNAKMAIAGAIAIGTIVAASRCGETMKKEYSARTEAACKQLENGQPVTDTEAITQPIDKDRIIGTCRSQFNIKIDEAAFDKSMTK